MLNNESKFHCNAVKFLVAKYTDGLINLFFSALLLCLSQ
jgi:hypothetical protein